MTITTEPNVEPLRLAPRRRHSISQALIPFCALTSGIMLGLAVVNLITGSGLAVAAKATLLALGGMAVAYGINRLAIERGAPLASVGYRSAGAVSLLSIMLVGIGLFAATYAGLVLKDVSRLRLEAHGAALAEYVSQRIKVASQASRISPAINAVVADLTGKRDCEIKSSCLSGNNNGGRGPVARMLDEKLGRAQSIALQIESGATLRQESQRRINEYLGRYQSVVRSPDHDVDDKWPLLRQIDAQIRQTLSDLDESVPLPMVAAYANELASGADISGRQDASRQLSVILRDYSASLKSAIASIDSHTASLPAFPGQTGVADTFNYMSHFAPIAAITAVVELVFPLVLWIYTFLTLRWADYQIAPPEASQPSDDEKMVAKILLRNEAPAERYAAGSTGKTPGRRDMRSNGYANPNRR